MYRHGRRRSELDRGPSKLGRTELLLLRRRRARCSPGSAGWRPEDLANRLRISVSDTTPVRRPDRCAPGRAAAGTAALAGMGKGDCGPDPVLDAGISTVVSPDVVAVRCSELPDELGLLTVGGDTWVGVSSGVAGADGEGEADSTIHMRWECVATSLATVWARVEYGLT